MLFGYEVTEAGEGGSKLPQKYKNAAHFLYGFPSDTNRGLKSNFLPSDLASSWLDFPSFKLHFGK